VCGLGCIGSSHKSSPIFAFDSGERVHMIGGLFLAPHQFVPTVEERRDEIFSRSFSGAASVPDQSNNASSDNFDKVSIADKLNSPFSATVSVFCPINLRLAQEVLSPSLLLFFLMMSFGHAA
jgi:hypothetical protein